MKKATIIPPVGQPSSLGVQFNIIVMCGKKAVEHCVVVEYDQDPNNPLMYNRQCVNAGAQEALPRGYDQDQVQGDVELAANDWTPWSFVLSPVKKEPGLTVPPAFTLDQICNGLQVSYKPVDGVLTITKRDEILYRESNMFEDDAANFETDNGQKWGIQLNEDSIDVYSIDEVSGERNETPIEVKFYKTD